MEANVSELPPLHYTVHTSAKERAVKKVTSAANAVCGFDRRYFISLYCLKKKRKNSVKANLLICIIINCISFLSYNSQKY